MAARGAWGTPSPLLSYRLPTHSFCRRRSWVAAAQGEAARPSGDRPPPACGAHQPAPAGNAQPSWLSNPAIAQRECMRQYYLATDTTDMLGIVARSSNVLDVNTTLALFSYTGARQASNWRLVALQTQHAGHHRLLLIP